jgi:hypothetical protein
MNARNDVSRPSDQSLDARLALAAAQLRFAAWVDFRVARWLEHCATKFEAAQRLFKTDRKPTREFGMGVSLVVLTGDRCQPRQTPKKGWSPSIH